MEFKQSFKNDEEMCDFLFETVGQYKYDCATFEVTKRLVSGIGGVGGIAEVGEVVVEACGCVERSPVPSTPLCSLLLNSQFIKFAKSPHCAMCGHCV